MTAAELSEAATLIRNRAANAIDHPDQRWTTDHSDEDGLILGAFHPDDIDDHGVASTGAVAFFAYPGGPEQRVHAHAFGAAAHMAGFDPQTAVAVADWLDGVAERWDEGAPDHRALRVARTYLRNVT